MDAFYENYGDESDTSDEEVGAAENDCGDGFIQDEHNLGISIQQANLNYESAGCEIVEPPDEITVAGNLEVMNEEVDLVLDQVVSECDMSYKPAEFQRVAVNALGSMKNVILISPTGSGK